MYTLYSFTASLVIICILDFCSIYSWEAAALYGVYDRLPVMTLSFMTFCFVISSVIYLGLRKERSEIVEERLRRSGITDEEDRPPKVQNIERVSENLFKASLDITGIDKEDFKKKKNIIESNFNKYLTDVRDGESPSFVDLYFSNVRLPREYRFSNALSKIDRAFQCVIGKDHQGEVISSIDSWPHGLIAGSTGSGKSTQMKSIISQFIHSTNFTDEKGDKLSAQVILCDLKKGVEFYQFEGIPSVSAYSELSEIVGILKTIVKEMNDRYVLARKKKREYTDLKEDKKDFIFLVIDEVSLLFAPVRKGDPEYDMRLEARKLMRDILKLGRASKISVLCGLQRPTKESIDVEVQENIDARICFKINTPEGSIRMLGNKNAIDLPEVSGRGIWKMGSTETEIQAPFITKSDIEKLKNNEINLFKSGIKNLNQEKLKPLSEVDAPVKRYDVAQKDDKGGEH